MGLTKKFRHSAKRSPNLGSSTRDSPAPDSRLLPAHLFKKVICLERKRTERSRKPFLLLLLEARTLIYTDHVLPKVAVALSTSTRETDVSGWYEENSVLGIIFTELCDKSVALESIRAKVTVALRSTLAADEANQISVSFHLFPEDPDTLKPERAVDADLYPDLRDRDGSKRLPRLLKRAMDIAGSALALILFSPAHLAICLAIALTSKGPILFRQERVGQYGRRFTMLKFRTMEVSCDSERHEEFVKRFIAGHVDTGNARQSHDVVYKITDDPRVTPVGRILRKTSLDELPQLINVLKGEMSLVGPRPPIPYELEGYSLWHRGRVLEAKPGMTGLWQVTGRSKTNFDDLVRLDLRYARTWSLWLDIKILLQTPRIILSGDGAY